MAPQPRWGGEPFGDPVGLGLGDEGEAGRDAPEAQLVQEMVRQVLGAVVHSHRQAACHAGRDRAVVLDQAHRQRLQRGEAVALLADVVADTLGVEVLDGDEGPAPAVLDGADADAVRRPLMSRVRVCINTSRVPHIVLIARAPICHDQLARLSDERFRMR
jgi:hypothetical protein